MLYRWTKDTGLANHTGSRLYREATFKPQTSAGEESCGGYFLHTLSTSIHGPKEDTAIPLSLALKHGSRL